MIANENKISLEFSSSTQKPIGVFDSGVGGISVLQHIHATLPNEHLIYFADSRYAPYGNRTAQEIQSRCFAISDFLISQGVKAIVVACNTATAAAIDAMRERYSVPIFGMEPAVKPAAAATKNGIVGVLATVGTLKSAQFAALLESYGRNVQVVTQGCEGLVECIEHGELDTESTRQLLQLYCEPLLREGADTIVLGCTHYPFVRPLIKQVVGDDIVLIDTGSAVAKHVQKRLAELSLLEQQFTAGRVEFWTNSQLPDAADIIWRLWGKPAKIHIV